MAHQVSMMYCIVSASFSVFSGLVEQTHIGDFLHALEKCTNLSTLVRYTTYVISICFV